MGLGKLRAARIWEFRLYRIALLVMFACCASWAQNRGTTSASSSDLARQNLGFVAASPAELKAVLLKDVGLMVELKRWVAKDATDHGQLLSDSDLTNDAIF